MPKFKYTGDSGRVFPAIPAGDGALAFTLEAGDVIECDANPDENYFTDAKSGKAVSPDARRDEQPAVEAPVEEPAPTT